MGRSSRTGAVLALSVVLAVLAAPGPRLQLAPFSKADPALAERAASHPGSSLSVIVRAGGPDASAAVRRLGGRVTADLPIVGGFAARLPASSLDDLLRVPAVLRVWGDAPVDVTASPDDTYDRWAPDTIWRSTTKVSQAASRFDGRGVTVAVLDTGVSPVPELGERVVARVDLTVERDGLDRYGHGTHLAGLIAGDGSVAEPGYPAGTYRGVAPGASVVSVKVAGWDGSTDVSVVIAGLQWVVANRDRYGIRVLNLSFGTDATQSYAIDPLDFAVEQVWFSGILVVVSAGNRGPAPDSVTKPGDDPFVLTVGAANLWDTQKRADDQVAPFSSWDPSLFGRTKPELVAPGLALVGPRVPGSTVDVLHPAALIGTSHTRGSGSSQAAAIVSGIAALMFQAAPSLTPDQVKSILVNTASRGGFAGEDGVGEGLVMADAAVDAALAGTALLPAANAGLVPSTGLGSLEASRGSLHVFADLDGDGDPEPVQGEVDVLGLPWDATTWGAKAWGAEAWAWSPWAPLVADGAQLTAKAWGGTSWEAKTWGTGTWDAKAWGADAWFAKTWGEETWG
jgi:serine protease AprX